VKIRARVTTDQRSLLDHAGDLRNGRMTSPTTIQTAGWMRNEASEERRKYMIVPLTANH
jgi:hypothetical protein